MSPRNLLPKNFVDSIRIILVRMLAVLILAMELPVLSSLFQDSLEMGPSSHRPQKHNLLELRLLIEQVQQALSIDQVYLGHSWHVVLDLLGIGILLYIVNLVCNHFKSRVHVEQYLVVTIPALTRQVDDPGANLLAFPIVKEAIQVDCTFADDEHVPHAIFSLNDHIAMPVQLALQPGKHLDDEGITCPLPAVEVFEEESEQPHVLGQDVLHKPILQVLRQLLVEAIVLEVHQSGVFHLVRQAVDAFIDLFAL